MIAVGRPRSSALTVGALIAVLLTIVIVGVVGSGVSKAVESARVGVIDTDNRAAVSASYRKHVAENIRIRTGWDGSADRCVAGGTTAEYTRATIETINWFRAMAGLPNVTENRGDSDAAQQAALMMHAANSLSHQPGRSWACHSESGAVAAERSNLTLGIAGPEGVVGQIEDAGAGNEALGHRRWLLYPELSEVGVGNTDRASAVQVIGNFGSDRSGKTWIAWPPAGHVPDAVTFERWSVAHSGPGNADFSHAQVAMTVDGRAISVRLLPRAGGFGDPTLVWEPGVDLGNVGADTRVRVQVTNVVVDGRSVDHAYDVIVFDAGSAASAPAPTTAGAMCGGLPATIIGTPGDDTIRGTAGIDVIVTMGGNDRIDGRGGNDRICSGAGRDVVRGGGGNDMIDGGGGRDRLSGNRGDDTVVGAGGRDVIAGNGGTDRCWRRTSRNVGANDAVRSCEYVG